MVVIRVNIQLNTQIVKILTFVYFHANSHSLKYSLPPPLSPCPKGAHPPNEPATSQQDSKAQLQSWGPSLE